MRVVLDANQYISALLRPDGLQAGLFSRARDGRLTIVLSEKILEEVVRVLAYPKIFKRLPVTIDDVQRFLHAITDVAEIVTGSIHVVSDCPDPDDRHYLAAAKEANADALVSGDHHLLDLKHFEGIPILTTAAFLRRLK